MLPRFSAAALLLLFTFCIVWCPPESEAARPTNNVGDEFDMEMEPDELPTALWYAILQSVLASYEAGDGLFADSVFSSLSVTDASELYMAHYAYSFTYPSYAFDIIVEPNVTSPLAPRVTESVCTDGCIELEECPDCVCRCECDLDCDGACPLDAPLSAPCPVCPPSPGLEDFFSESEPIPDPPTGPGCLSDDECGGHVGCVFGVCDVLLGTCELVAAPDGMPCVDDEAPPCMGLGECHQLRCIHEPLPHDAHCMSDSTCAVLECDSLGCGDQAEEDDPDFGECGLPHPCSAESGCNGRGMCVFAEPDCDDLDPCTFDYCTDSGCENPPDETCSQNSGSVEEEDGSRQESAWFIVAIVALVSCFALTVALLMLLFAPVRGDTEMMYAYTATKSQIHIM